MLPLICAGILVTSSVTGAEDKKPTVQPAKCGMIRRLHELNGIYLAGQPSGKDLEVARKKGIKSIINLRPKRELSFNEEAIAKKLGMKYYHVPFAAPETLTDKVFDQVRTILKDKENRPILLHCGSANRVGAVWLAHRMLDDKLSFEEARKEARTVGLRTQAYLAKAWKYVQKNK